ncbi:M28 family peptidase [Gilvibacter sediminis]|uniref:M28 family peptidase n=1 Tax=Gilvibacter sediminis TaxID=379071 RepID=UPI00235035FB|nr:M28 family peptidase [Gilvibacter sediminis]MDC7996626.1 M28 family peptidase [Gilvibacter sediminis]
MKRTSHLLSLLLIIGLVWYSFYSLMPTKISDESAPETEFSTARALVHLEEIAAEPHYLGSEAHNKVREYISQQLAAMGLEVSIQEAYDLNQNWGQLVKPKNILARIKGSEDGKSLVLLSHYDSAQSYSHGASDAGSGVVTIMESVRAYLASGKTPKNDIIICITDSEELGLNGASTFVNQHPWAKNVGLVLNFEARGSGGPSNMIVETNGGNRNLIKAFAEANPDFPVASSLMYSIYKMLPNDTDSTVFREDGDIDSFFFAFIDDHYDYHTVNDNYENLDRNSLEHQGSYLMPLLTYFAEADLGSLKAEEDHVYVNLPLVDFINYPFSWILPMVLIGWFAFLGLLLWGTKKKALKGKEWGKAGGVFLLSLIVSALLTHGMMWLLYKVYPQYGEIQHGFTYNGHYYIVAFVMLTLAVYFGLYSRFCATISRANLMVVPLLLWMIVNTAVALYLPGAAYFIIPVYFGFFILGYLIKAPEANPLLIAILSAPAVLMFSPLVQFFPVGLGLEMLVASVVFTGLLFGLIASVTGAFPFNKYLWKVSLFFLLIFLIAAHTQSSWSEERPKPNSLVYYQDNDDQRAFMLTYDGMLDDWTRAVLGEAPVAADSLVSSVAGSKYNTGYTYGTSFDNKRIPSLQGTLTADTTVANRYTLTLIPKRKINRIAIYADTSYHFKALAYNEQTVKPDSTGYIWSKRRSNFMGRYHITDSDPLTIDFETDSETMPVFKFLSYSYDLLSRDEFDIPERSAEMIPSPFVVKDAIVTKDVFRTSELKQVVQDTIRLE